MKPNCFSAISVALISAAACLAQNTVPLNPSPSRIVGHPNPETNANIVSISPNLVEGREMWNPNGLALDTSVTPPILYVADSSNNRVLAWKNATGFTNGQPADLVIGRGTSGGGAEFFSTFPLGPATAFSTGLYLPSSLLVDKNGDLYIADTGNNRILRFRKPFANAGNLFPDLYIGQQNLSQRLGNLTGGVAAQGLLFPAGLAMDSAGNLWVLDEGNRRVLRFAASDVAAGGGPLTANVVIGQLSFTSLAQPVSKDNNNATAANIFATPLAIAFDPQGRLYVSDSDGTVVNRVLVFDPNCTTPKYTGSFATANMSACRFMGLPSTNDPSVVIKTIFSIPNSLFFIPGASKMGVVDAGYHRILVFDSYEKWPDPTVSLSPQATGIVGQPTFSNYGANEGINFSPPPTPDSLDAPSVALFYNNELYIADSSNNRVVVRPLADPTAVQVFGVATRVLGQDLFDMDAANLIEGREFSFTNPNLSVGGSDGGIAIDATGDTPHLYVADTYNHRVLGFRDYRKVGPGVKADLVIGQGDLKHGLCNQTGNPNGPSSSSLCFPTGLLVDPNGNLYVADWGNGRVLRFPAPFAHQGVEQADVVLGQHNMTTIIRDPSPFTMAAPYGIAFSGTNGLLVSDTFHSRVLFFPFTNGDFTSADSGKAATKVFGQPNFTSFASGSALSQFSGPHGVASDSDGRPYVVDSGNSRVLIFDTLVNNQNGAPAVVAISTGLASPRGIYINQTTGESWITDTNDSPTFPVKKFPRFDTLITNQAPTALVQSGGPALAVTQDQYGALVVADTSNRIAFYYPGLTAVNGASLRANQGLAPGMFASICSPLLTTTATPCDINKVSYLGPNTASSGDLPNPFPMPTALGDVTVLFNGTAVPLYYVSPNQINFYVPMGAPATGNSDIVVQQASTGRIYAAGSAPMTTFSPGIIMSDYTGKNRQAVVVNTTDGTGVNSPTNPAAACSVITIYATGQGVVPNAPPDGSPAPASPLLTTPTTPRVYINAFPVDQYPQSNPCDPPAGQWVQFSGLAPGYVGLWQINVHVPGAVAAGSQVPVFIVMGSALSIDSSFTTTIAVKAKQ